MVDNYQMYINVHKDKHRNQRLWQTTVQILDWITRSTKKLPMATRDHRRYWIGSQDHEKKLNIATRDC